MGAVEVTDRSGLTTPAASPGARPVGLETPAVVSILNEHLRFDNAPSDVRRAFRGRVEKRLLLPGRELYKFTQATISRGPGGVTPWWSSVIPLSAEDPGLEGTLERAERLGVLPEEFMRSRAAVTRQWNTLKNLVRVELKTAIYAFFGQCSAQHVDDGSDPDLANVVFIGGAWQLWIPNLSRSAIEVLT
jgi:hypothetical protein